MEIPQHFYTHRKLENLVENRTTYTVESAELNVYETHHYAEEVILQFHQPVFASMIEGKKIMHLRDQDPFDFLPGQSVMMPSNEVMKIDFPEATENNPTRCLAMTVAPEKIKRIIEELNYAYPKSDEEWRPSSINYTFSNDEAIRQIINRLMFLFIENHESKDLFVDMMLRELVVRILQSENRFQLEARSDTLSGSNRLATTLRYIKNNLDKPISVTELSEKVCTSESNFYKIFRNELGVTPVEYINSERIKKATQMLSNPEVKIKEVYMACGFNNISYFVRAFKKFTQKTPSQFQNESKTLY